MKAIDIIRSNRDYFSLPKERPHDQYFPDYVKENLEYYKELLNELDKQEFFPSKEKLELLADKTIECVNKAYEGNRIAAYNTLVTGTEGIKRNLSLYKSDHARYLTLYRARTESELLTKSEMFHVPFDKRYLLGDQRYSLQGLPCLYLCNASYLCWEELGRPSLDSFQVSRCEVDTEEIKFIDLNLTADLIINSYHMKVEEAVVAPIAQHFVTNWPLIFSTSIRRNGTDDKFKPEYIVPQLLLQWVKNNTEYQGVKYISTKNLTVQNEAKFLLSNYVIPVINIADKGHCSFLKQNTKITAPTSKALFDIYGFSYDKKDAKVLLKKDVNWNSPTQIFCNLELTEGNKGSYIETIFGKFEIHLDNQNASSL